MLDDETLEHIDSMVRKAVAKARQRGRDDATIRAAVLDNLVGSIEQFIHGQVEQETWLVECRAALSSSPIAPFRPTCSRARNNHGIAPSWVSLARNRRLLRRSLVWQTERRRDSSS